MVVSAKTRIPKAGQANTNILKRIGGGKIQSPTDMQGHGLRLKVKKINSKMFHFEIDEMKICDKCEKISPKTYFFKKKQKQ